MSVKVIKGNSPNTIDYVIPAEDERFPGVKKIFVSLVLDLSGSMQGEPLQKLEQAVMQFIDAIKKNSLTRKAVEIEIIGFHADKVEIISGLNLVDELSLSPLSAQGNTPMGEAIEVAFSRLEERKKSARKNGLLYWRPWFVLITDGEPTDMNRGDARWQKIKAKIENQEAGKHAICWAFGTTTEAEEALSDLFPTEHAFSIDVADFSKVLLLMSYSLELVSTPDPNKNEIQIYRPDGKIISVEI